MNSQLLILCFGCNWHAICDQLIFVVWNTLLSCSHRILLLYGLTANSLNQAHFWLARRQIWILARTLGIPAEILHGFHRAYRYFPGHYLKLGHDCFLSRPYPFIIYNHKIIQYYTVFTAADSAIQLTRGK